MGETQSYSGKGKLGQAIIDFRKHYCLGATQEWPLYWKEFADQAFADLISVEVEKADLKSKLEKAKEELKWYANEANEVDNMGYRGFNYDNGDRAREVLKNLEGLE